MPRMPLAGFRFRVQITGGNVIADTGFKSVSGLKTSVNFNDYREGGDELSMRQIAGMYTFEPITLSRGLSQDIDAIQALDKLRTRPQEESTVQVTITLMDRDGTPRLEYFIARGWIAELEHGELDAQSEDVVMETLTIRHEGFIPRKL